MSLKNDMICKLLELNGVSPYLTESLCDVIEKLKNRNYPTPEYINNIKIKTNGYFLYDGCHKIYITENDKEIDELEPCGYLVLPIELLPLIYKTSCPFKFISSADLNTQYVKQCTKDVLFMYKKV